VTDLMNPADDSQRKGESVAHQKEAAKTPERQTTSEKRKRGRPRRVDFRPKAPPGKAPRPAAGVHSGFIAKATKQAKKRSEALAYHVRIQI
jgi:hypothetical protein